MYRVGPRRSGAGVQDVHCELERGKPICGREQGVSERYWDLMGCRERSRLDTTGQMVWLTQMPRTGGPSIRIDDRAGGGGECEAMEVDEQGTSASQPTEVGEPVQSECPEAKEDGTNVDTDGGRKSDSR